MHKPGIRKQVPGVIFCFQKTENYFTARCGILLSGKQKAFDSVFQKRGIRWKENLSCPWV